MQAPTHDLGKTCAYNTIQIGRDLEGKLRREKEGDGDEIREDTRREGGRAREKKRRD